MAVEEPREKPSNFVREIVLEHNASGRFAGQVITRSPPEPNGYLHIGHAKAICIDFGMAQEFGGRLHLGFDDNNPTKESQGNGAAHHRGTWTEGGRGSPYRNRPAEESLDLLERMRRGEFEEGTRTLRARIDMTSGNLNLRDPVMYRIRKAPHQRPGEAWCSYPMYDWGR